MKKGNQPGNSSWERYADLFEMFDRAGVSNDMRWRSLLLYFREIKDYTHLTDSQKVAVQKLLADVIESKEYTEKKLRTVLREYQNIITAPQKQKIEVLLREAADIISGFQTLLTCRYGDVAELEETTITVVEQETDEVELLAKLRKSFHKVKDLLEKDISSLEAMATRDSLTGLANRRAFDDFMENSVNVWLNEEQPLALALFDIDHFKRFNDKYGHRVGDQVIITVAKELKKGLEEFSERNETMVARYGGEEFALVVLGPASKRLAEVCDKIRRKVSAVSFMVRNNEGDVLGTGLNITISAGVSEAWYGWNGAYEENLIDAADKALYKAKFSGRDQTIYCVYQEGFEPQHRKFEPEKTPR